MFLLLLLALEPADSLPVAVSPVVGIEVDAAERRRFHLFPGIEEFSCAVFHRLADGSYSVSVRSDSAPPARYPVTTEQFRRIGLFIDRYEEIVNELAALPDGRPRYFELWRGIGPQPPELDTSSRGAPPASRWSGRVVDGLAGAACSLGIGGAVGAIGATRFVESRPESVLTQSCSGGSYWYYYSVDVYELNRGGYAAYAAPAGVAGTAAGFALGSVRDRRGRAVAAGRRGIAGYDLFGDAIYSAEATNRLNVSNRLGWTILGAASGWLAGTGAGLLLTGIARGIMFQPNKWDTIIVRNDGFALDLPLLVLSLAGLVKGADVGYRHGLKLDWQEALEKTRRSRLLPGR